MGLAMSSSTTRKRGALPRYRVGQWFADSTGNRGSQIASVANDRRSTTVGLLESYAIAALTPATTGRYISAVTTQATRLGGGKYRLLVNYRSRKGDARALPFELEG
jgi:phage gp46-like protein